jgi:hypothetical protein
MTEISDTETCALVLNWCDTIVRASDSCAETARLIELAREAFELGQYELCVRLATDAAAPALPPLERGAPR